MEAQVPPCHNSIWIAQGLTGTTTLTATVAFTELLAERCGCLRFEPGVEVLSDEGVIVKMGIGGVDTVNFFQLTRAE